MKQKYIILMILAGLIGVNVLAQHLNMQHPVTSTPAKVAYIEPAAQPSAVSNIPSFPSSGVVAQNEIRGKNAGGESQITVIDQGGNLKVVQQPDNQPNSTKPVVKSVPDNDQAEPELPPAKPSDKAAVIPPIARPAGQPAPPPSSINPTPLAPTTMQQQNNINTPTPAPGAPTGVTVPPPAISPSSQPVINMGLPSTPVTGTQQPAPAQPAPASGTAPTPTTTPTTTPGATPSTSTTTSTTTTAPTGTSNP